MTVDRVHVLATPGLDRHAAYVALSRHRDAVQLHYGEDDFADRGKLVRTLSRERSKDLASDYAGEAGPARSFAERRGITFGERVADVVRRIAPKPVRELAAAIRAAASPPERTPEQQALADNKAAIVRHARAVDEIFEMQEQGLAASASQLEELKLARRQLEGRREHASRHMEAVYKREPALALEAAGGTVRRAVAAMQLEAELRTNPLARADAFVAR